MRHTHHFCNRVSRVAAQERYSLRQVARDLGLAVATINAWELGERFPTGSHFEMIANYTDVPPCQLVCRKADKCVRADCLVEMGRKASAKAGTGNKRRR